MSYRLTAIFWVVAVAAVAMVTFGVLGAGIAIIMVALWAYIFDSHMRWIQVKRLLGVVVAFFLMIFLFGLLAASVTTPREAARRNHCLSQMKQLALAMHLYHDAHGEFPPAYLADANQSPILSWRVLLLPFAEESALYHRFDLTKAWNDPANSNLNPTQQLICTCPSNQISTSDADYFAVVAPDTLWPDSKSLSTSQVTDGLSNTIALIEVRGRKIKWAEPRDLTFDEAMMVLTTEAKHDDGHRIKLSFFHRQVVARNIVFADGRGMFLREPIDRDLAIALLTANGGEKIAEEVNKLRKSAGSMPLDYAAIYSLIAFAVVSLLPLTKFLRAENSAE